jgi:uncharacterized protein YjbJ (UPF0337 family)
MGDGEGKFDELKGRGKVATGELTGNDDLKREGQVDKATGNVKQATSDAIDSIRDKVNH